MSGFSSASFCVMYAFVWFWGIFLVCFSERICLMFWRMVSSSSGFSLGGVRNGEGMSGLLVVCWEGVWVVVFRMSGVFEEM